MACVLEFQNLTDEKLLKLEKQRTIAFLPISLLEAHGPHLPLGTDLMIATRFAELLAHEVCKIKNDSTMILLPPVPMGVGGIDRPGTLNHAQNLVEQVIVEFGLKLAQYGIKNGVMISGHAGRDHLQALYNASRKIKRSAEMEFLPLTSYLFMDTGMEKISGEIKKRQSKVGDQLPPYDGHAGQWETSVMKYLYPEQVLKVHATLPHSDDAEATGYRGNPAGANAELGEALIRFLLDVALNIMKNHFSFLN